jgi:GT2 family glycosyltransferase
MVSIDYCILTMEIMEIYHKCSSDNDSQIWPMLFDFSQLYTKNITKNTFKIISTNTIHFSMHHIWNFSIYYDLLIIKYHLLIIHLFLISYIFIIIWANGPRARANVYSGKRTRNHFRRGTPNSIHRYLNSY